jgi:acrylyl-CoA reductase (NADPH)
VTASEFPALRTGPVEDGFERTVTTLALADLPEDGVLVEVEWSSVNYKDALAASADGRVARISPLVPGVDLAGRLAEDTESFPAGSVVLAHGYDIGVSRHGGFAGLARVPAEWIVEIPAGLGTRDAMVIGTAGFTAAQSVVALEDRGLTPDAGPVLVTGATGGVGSMAVTILAGRGYEVVASTGKEKSHDYLRSLGASEIIDRSTFAEPGRPLDSAKWAAAVDCVGGVTLANVISRITYGGAVAASGVTGGAQVPTTVMPFILRGVALLGIDSVQTPMERRRAVWKRLGGDLKPAGLELIGHDIGLVDLDSTLTSILAGGVTGRFVVDPWR